MLICFNNHESRASPANENFARELLKVHTLGIAAYLDEGHPRGRDVPTRTDRVAVAYIDEDVYDVARP